jgi:hypothetical protein
MQKYEKNAKNNEILHNYLIVNINKFKCEMASNEGMLVKITMDGVLLFTQVGVVIFFYSLWVSCNLIYNYK